MFIVFSLAQLLISLISSRYLYFNLSKKGKECLLLIQDKRSCTSMDFRHISHGKQQNKPHGKTVGARRTGGKVENATGVSNGAAALASSRE